MPTKLKNLSPKDQTYWFIGFVEGVGAWEIDSKTGRFKFTIEQSNPQVLYKLKQFVGYGQVNGPYSRKKGSTFYRYRVGNLPGTKRLIEIINGNLVLAKTRQSFKDYLRMYNSIQPDVDKIPFKNTAHLPSLNDAWFSGFVDAQGSFSGFIRKSQKSGEYTSAVVRFSIVRKDEHELFKHLKTVFGGSLQYREQTKNSRLQLQSIKDTSRLIGYLAKFPLHSAKTIPFTRFKKIHVRITDGKFEWRLQSRRAKERLFTLVKNINSDFKNNTNIK